MDLAESLRPYRALLHSRNYRLWFTSSLASSLGDWVGIFALQVLVVSLAEPGSRLALFGLGGIMTARLLPSVVFGPFAGVVADRYSRRTLMVGSDVARAGLFAVVAFTRDVWLLFVLVFLIECMSLIYVSAKNAVLPHIVEQQDLAQANQLTLVVTYGPMPFGAAVDGLLAWLSGRAGLEDPTAATLLGTALLFAVGGAILVRLRVPSGGEPEGQDEDGAGPLAQLREGLHAILDRPLIRSLVFGVVGVFFGAGVFIALGPAFVGAELGRPHGDWYGLMTVVGFGLLAGIAAAPALASRFGAVRVVRISLPLTAAAALAAATLPSFPPVQVAGAALGAFTGVSFVTGFTLLHARTEGATRARTFAAVYTGTRIAMFASLALGPFLAGAVATRSLDVADRSFTLSGIRSVLLMGAVVALASAAFTAAGLRGDERDP